MLKNGVNKDNIELLNNLSGLTHKEWGKKLNMNIATVSIKLNCTTSWKVEEAYIFANHFGLSIEQAFFRKLDLSKVVIK